MHFPVFSLREKTKYLANNVHLLFNHNKTGNSTCRRLRRIRTRLEVVQMIVVGFVPGGQLGLHLPITQLLESFRTVGPLLDISHLESHNFRHSHYI